MSTSPRLDPRRVLALPAAYRLFSNLLGARRSRAEIVRLYVRPRPGDVVLDCGCGPGDLLDVLHGVEYTGLDVDEAYITEARERYGERAAFRLGPIGAETVPETEHFDLVLAMGVLHHLDDATVRGFFDVARRALRPGGRVVTIDPCFVDGQSAIARRLVAGDRGEHVRRLEAWRPLVEPAFPDVVMHVRHDLLRLPYTHLVMEAER